MKKDGRFASLLGFCLHLGGQPGGIKLLRDHIDNLYKGKELRERVSQIKLHLTVLDLDSTLRVRL